MKLSFLFPSQQHTSTFYRILVGVFLLISSTVLYNPIQAQTVGDFKSRASGNWSDFNTWAVYDGAVWNNAIAGQVPSGTNEADANNVYLEAGFTVSLLSNQTCKNLNLNTTADVIRINTNDNVLEVWGKMKFYEGTAPGAGTPNPVVSSGVLGWITTGANGYIRFKGSVDRIIMVQGEINSNNSNSGWNLDFAFDNGKVGQMNDRMRAGNATISSGEFYMSNINAHIRVGTNGPGDVTPNGRFVVRAGATMRGGEGVFKNGTTAAESIIVEDGGALVITRSSYILAAVSLDLSGTVILQNAINFPTPSGRASATPVNTFASLTLEGTGAKTLLNSINVSGVLKRAETATLTLNTFALAYGLNAELEYKGTTAQTTTNAEFPAVAGPAKLTINNANGVTLHADRAIEGALNLKAGLFLLGNFNFTLGALSPAVLGTPFTTNMVVTSGTGELRKIFDTPGNFIFPIGETTGTADFSSARVDLNSTNLDATTYMGVRVIGTDHAASASSADRIARYWKVNSNIAVLDYGLTLQYLASDVVGTEANINAYNYDGETALAIGTPIARVNSALQRIELTSLTSLGFVTGANFCAISNNTIDYTGTSVFCVSASLSEDFVGTTAVVPSSSPTYQWQTKVNNGSWTDISVGGINKDYTESNSLAGPNTYYYHRIVSDLTACLAQDFDTSNDLVITVNEAIGGNEIGSDQEIEEGGTPAQFTETNTLSGGGSAYTYKWQVASVSGGPYADITTSGDQATYTAPDGITQDAYYIRVVNAGGCPESISNEVALTITIPTSTTSAESIQGVRLYPNPVASQLVIDLDLTLHQDVKVLISNARGEMIYNGAVNQLSKQTIDLSSQPSGVYFARLVLDGTQNVTYKVIKH